MTTTYEYRTYISDSTNNIFDYEIRTPFNGGFVIDTYRDIEGNFKWEFIDKNKLFKIEQMLEKKKDPVMDVVDKELSDI